MALMGNPRRGTLKTLLAFAGSIALTGWQQRAWAITDRSTKEKDDARVEEQQARELKLMLRREELKSQLRDAEEREAKKVEQLYSTKPHRFRMAGREYLIPANYFTPKGRDDPDGGESKGFGFFLFLPDYGGYTKENWRDPFDRRRIDVVQVEPVEKNAMGNFTDGSRRPLSPDRFDPRKRFERARLLLEDRGTELYGLVVYRNKGGGATPGAVWTGTRSNGEFFFFRTSLAPGESAKNGYPSNPQCDVRYYSEKEDLSIVYRYSLNHIAEWREIDDAIWAKLHGWQVK
jgi:hypothetical protein